MPTDGSDSSQGGGPPVPLGDDPETRVDGDDDSRKARAAEELESKLEMIGRAALISVTMAVRSAAARGGDGLSDEQRDELAEVRRKLAASLAALDEQSRQGGLGTVDLQPLREKIVRSIRELDEHLLPDHPGQHSGAHEVLPS